MMSAMVSDNETSYSWGIRGKSPQTLAYTDHTMEQCVSDSSYPTISAVKHAYDKWRARSGRVWSDHQGSSAQTAEPAQKTRL